MDLSTPIVQVIRSRNRTNPTFPNNSITNHNRILAKQRNQIGKNKAKKKKYRKEKKGNSKKRPKKGGSLPNLTSSSVSLLTFSGRQS